ncbi:MAG: hypothetical protein ACRC92_02260 [Peptostreptococcaceae bacterium]
MANIKTDGAIEATSSSDEFVKQSARIGICPKGCSIFTWLEEIFLTGNKIESRQVDADEIKI